MKQRQTASSTETTTTTEAAEESVPQRGSRGNVLRGLSPADVTAQLAEAARDSARSLSDESEAVEELRDALRLLREGNTHALLEWRPRVALGGVVAAIVRAFPSSQSVAKCARDGLLAVAASAGERHMGRAEYYGEDVAHPVPTADGAPLESLPTEGWGSLEVALWSLAAVVDVCGVGEAHERDAALAAAVAAASHLNRYVRQVGMTLIASLCRRSPTSADSLSVFVASGAHSAIAGCLADPWAQVRFAAAQAARAILDVHPSGRSVLLPVMLPSLFVSRHDAAEGVRIQSQVNWRLAVNLNGKSLLAANAQGAVDLLHAMSSGGSHELRSAACVAAGEMAVAISRRTVAPHATKLLGVIINGLGDGHWAVRLAACNAYHDFAGVFPAVARGASVEKVLLALTGDEVACVREASAAAVGAWARSFTDEDERRSVARPLVLARTRELLESIREEPLPEGATRDSVCSDAQRRSFFNDTSVHTSQTAIGCCSLEPASTTSKPHSHSDGDGDGHDHGDQDEHRAEPWQRVIGGVYMAREVTRLWPEEDVAATVMPLLDEAFRARWFVHYPNVASVVNQQLPHILDALGDRGIPYRGLPLLKPPTQ